MTPWPVSVYLLATHRSTTLTWINIWRLTTIALHCYCCYLSIQTVIDPLELKPVPVGTDKAQTIRFIIVIGLRCEIKNSNVHTVGYHLTTPTWFNIWRLWPLHYYCLRIHWTSSSAHSYGSTSITSDSADFEIKFLKCTHCGIVGD